MSYQPFDLPNNLSLGGLLSKEDAGNRYYHNEQGR
jgi:hypothetical protein